MIALAYLTGNDHLVRGVRYTYLIGRNSPEIDDRDFFPYAHHSGHSSHSLGLPANATASWPSSRTGKDT